MKPGSPFRLLTIAVIVCTSAAAHADPAAGEKIFKQQCGVCHSTLAGKTLAGPSLAGVIGRTSGSIEGFRYSNGMKSANIVWSPDTLAAFIESPRRVVPSTLMAYPGERNEVKRADITDYLATLE